MVFMHPRYRVGRLPKAKAAWDSVSATSARRVSMSVHVAGCGPARAACRAGCCTWGGHVSSRDPVFLRGPRAHTTHAAQVFVSNSPCLVGVPRRARGRVQRCAQEVVGGEAREGGQAAGEAGDE